ncbi:MAG: hypothetical protein NXY57DRAFT_958940 [Lentinula lateritia]|nr:MAG: hypothetical protein NXY57DRAFT_958940 [Lentinula lateritia]
MVLKSGDRVQGKICRSVRGISEADNAKCSCIGDEFPPIGDTPAEQCRQAHSAKGALQTRFMDLTTAENNFELLVPEEEEEENEGGDCEERELLLSDKDTKERDAKLRRPLKKRRRGFCQAEFRSFDLVFLNLPTLILRPYDNVGKGELGAAEKLVDAELASPIQHDSLEHPIPGTSRPVKSMDESGKKPPALANLIHKNPSRPKPLTARSFIYARKTGTTSLAEPVLAPQPKTVRPPSPALVYISTKPPIPD